MTLDDLHMVILPITGYHRVLSLSNTMETGGEKLADFDLLSATAIEHNLTLNGQLFKESGLTLA